MSCTVPHVCVCVHMYISRSALFTSLAFWHCSFFFSCDWYDTCLYNMLYMTYIDINLIYVMYMCVHKYMECEFNFPVRSFFSSMSAASSIKAGVDHPPLPPSDCFYFSSRNQHKSDTSSILVVAPVSPHLASFPIDFLSVALHQN